MSAISVERSLGHGKFELAGRVSYDGGVTWTHTPRILGGDSVGFHGVAHNSLYRNFIFAWASDDDDANVKRVEAGGFRAQTLTPSGFAAGAASVNFDLDFFDPGADPFAWALLALSPSDLFIVEGKVLGLFPDTLFTASVGLAAAGALSSAVDAQGSGATPTLAVNLPPGLTLYAIGLGLDPGGATVDVGSITDVMEIRL